MRLIAVFTLLFAVQVHADIVARVTDAKGHVFAFDSDGNSKRLAFGSRINDMSEIMVDDSSYLSVLDSSGNEHHLAGGAYVKFYNQLLEIKNGNVWTLAKGERPALLNTVNSVVRCAGGQVITSVNNQDLKTQVLSLSGEAKLASSIEPALAIDVPAGHFSFIDQAYEGGLPRTPTRVGLSSYQDMKSVFANVKSLKENDFEQGLFGFPKDNTVKPEAKREIASVKKSVKKGKIIFIKTHKAANTAKRIPASAGKVSAADYYQSVKKEQKNKKSKAKAHASVAKVRYFGVDFSDNSGATVVQQQPQNEKTIEKASASASFTPKKIGIVINPITSKEVEDKVKRLPASADSSGIVNDINSAFEKSLSNKLENNKRHPDEVNDLIDELKSFKKDYSKHY